MKIIMNYFLHVIMKSINKGKYIEQSLEYGKNNVDTKVKVVHDLLTCQSHINNDKKYEKVIKKFNCTAPINEYNHYKDNTTYKN